jgi:Ca2+-binding EF-hand superfamily protein
MGGRASKHDKELEFIQETATGLGLSNDFLQSKAELYDQYAAEDKLLNFGEFSELYTELSCDVYEDEYLDDYVKAIFRAFDSDQDGQLTFKEWRLGYLFLLTLDKEGGGPGSSQADWGRGMEAIYRVYDMDGDGVLSREELQHITKVDGSFGMAMPIFDSLK